MSGWPGLYAMPSIYSQRDEPAYGAPEAREVYARTPGILAWWRAEYDDTIRAAIDDLLWYWTCDITNRLKSVVPDEVLNQWIETDSLCERFAWYNVLSRFAESRAIFGGWTKVIPEAQRRACLLCNLSFLETSLPYPLARRLGVRQLNFCAPCLSDSILQTPRTNANPEEIIAYLRSMARLIGRAPRQGFGEGMSDLLPFGDRERIAIIKLLATRPPTSEVKHHFGTWKDALAAAGLKLAPGRKKQTSGPSV